MDWNKIISKEISAAQGADLKYFKSKKEALQFALSCVDLTTLEGSDTDEKVRQLCQKAISVKPHTAAVCVYPVFAKLAKQILNAYDVHVACVAGGFPAGQIPLESKLSEVNYAVAQGADEIDMVISRGKFLEGKLEEVAKEIRAIKACCKDKILKVILETGELQTPENIYQAAMLAMENGADFIKTSTGKIAVNSTPEAFIVMLYAIRDYKKKTGKCISIKPAGGISDPDTTLLYIKLIENILGKEWLNNQRFRIGASRLVDRLLPEI
ncbi:MAG: deoxyribose-phosphate aldolase [Bacteroidales bacterium]|nr:deoxyribose-phosphate aldolase [Bacteroidales bacterium]